MVRDAKLDTAQSDAQALGRALRETNDRLEAGATIRGPFPAPIARIGGYHRQQIEILAADAVRIQKLLSAVRDAGMLTSDTHTAVDVDPVTLI